MIIRTGYVYTLRMLHANQPWLHYDQTNDKVYCFMCMKASKVGNFRLCAARATMLFSLVATQTRRMLVGINEGVCCSGAFPSSQVFC